MQHPSKDGFEASHLAIRQWEILGALNLQNLLIDGLLVLGQEEEKHFYKYGVTVLNGDTIYTGQLDQNDKPNGIGRERSKNGAIYEGQYKDGTYEGWGRKIYSGGRYYIG